MATFLETIKELLEKTVAVQCHTMTPEPHTKSHRANKMESTFASHIYIYIITHEQFSSVHRDQVADKPLRLRHCLMEARRFLTKAQCNWPERSVLWILPAVMPGSIEHNVAVYTTIHHSIAEFKNVSCKSTSSYLHCLYLLWFLRFYFVYAMRQIIFASCYNMDTWLQHRSSPALWKQQLTRSLDSLSVCVSKWGERAHVGMPFCLGFLSIRFHFRKPAWFSKFWSTAA